MNLMSRVAGVVSARRDASRLLVPSVLIACLTVGAAVGAGTHPGSEDNFRSEQVVSVNTPSAAFQPVAWRTFAQAMQVPEVRARIAQLADVEASSVHIGTSGDPDSSLITVYATADSASQANTIVSAAVATAVSFLQQTVYPAAVTRSTFGAATEGWDTGKGIFVLPPTHQTQVPKAGRGGSGALSVSCPAAGCGPYLVVNRLFAAGTTYLASGWVNSQPSTRMRIVLGASPRDVAVGPTIAGNSTWRHFEVRWTPSQRAFRAVTSFQVVSTSGSSFLVDDVAVGPQSAFAGEANQAPRASYSAIVPAMASSVRSGGHTAAWAGIGAAIGLLAGVAAVGSAMTANARRRALRAARRDATVVS
jgi:hypothetical protein